MQLWRHLLRQALFAAALVLIAAASHEQGSVVAVGSSVRDDNDAV